MARAPAVETMNLRQIEALAARIADAKAAAVEEAKVEVRVQLDVMLERSGLTIADLYPSARRAKGHSKVTVKYRNPKDPSQTRSGRGRKPNWLINATKKGAKLESFAI